MDYLNVIVAAAACWAFGAVWYMVLAKPWVAAAGIEVDENGKPKGESAAPFIISFICMVIVAGMMRHMFAMAGIESCVKSLVAGLGVGAFFIAPWMLLNHGYEMKPKALTLINGGYAVIGCGIIGTVLSLF